jgi:hypothetical protein
MMKIVKLITVIVAILLALTAFNCKDSETPTESNGDPFVGTWEANNNIDGTLMYYDGTAINDNFKIDARILGAAVKIIVDEDYKFDLTLVEPQKPDTMFTGDIIIDGDQVTMLPEGASEPWLIATFSIEDNFATLVSDDVTFPFDFVNEYPAVLTLILKKTN